MDVGLHIQTQGGKMMEEINNNTGENVQNEHITETNTTDSQNSNLGNPDYQNANPGNNNTGFQPNPNPVNPNAGYQNPGYQNQNFQPQQQYNPNYYQAPGYQNQGYQQNPNFQNPGFQRPGFQNQGFQPPQGGIPGLLYNLSLTGWATYYGVFKIILGSLLSVFSILILATGVSFYTILAISLIGLSVLLIISGVKTINFTEAMKRYAQSKDTNRIAEAFTKLNQYFVVSGILSFVIILLIIVYIIFSLDYAHSYRNLFRF